MRRSRLLILILLHSDNIAFPIDLMFLATVQIFSLTLLCLLWTFPGELLAVVYALKSWFIVKLLTIRMMNEWKSYRFLRYNLMAEAAATDGRWHHKSHKQAIATDRWPADHGMSIDTGRWLLPASCWLLPPVLVISHIYDCRHDREARREGICCEEAFLLLCSRWSGFGWRTFIFYGCSTIVRVPGSPVDRRSQLSSSYYSMRCVHYGHPRRHRGKGLRPVHTVKIPD